MFFANEKSAMFSSIFVVVGVYVILVVLIIMFLFKSECLRIQIVLPPPGTSLTHCITGAVEVSRLGDDYNGIVISNVCFLLNAMLCLPERGNSNSLNIIIEPNGN